MGLSLRQLAWRRLKRDKAAMFAMWLLMVIFLTALLAPLITVCSASIPTTST